MKKLIGLALTFAVLFQANSKSADSKTNLASLPFAAAIPLQKGAPLQLKDLQSQVVLLDFWASWCEPCKEALPHYAEMEKKYKSRGLKVVGINEDSSSIERESFLKKMNLHFPLYEDKDQAFVKALGVEALPTLVIFNSSGKVIQRLEGFEKKDLVMLEKKINELLP